MKMQYSKNGLLRIVTLLLLLAGGWVTATTLNRVAQLNDPFFLTRLAQRLDAWSGALKEERVYVQVDKPVYEPGETIWMSAQVVNTVDLKPSVTSGILHLEFINPKGSVERNYKLVLKNGRAAADVQLAADAPGGIYKIKAYTQHQKNDTTQLLFEKEITVQTLIIPRIKTKLDFVRKAYGPGDEVKATLKLESNQNKPLALTPVTYVVNVAGQKLAEYKVQTDANGQCVLNFNLPGKLKTTDVTVNALVDFEGQTESIQRSVPVVLNQISLEFFPEGGDMICGLEGRVAFRARNEFGKPADVEGYIQDDAGRKVASFKSFHQGMGAFTLNPREEAKYYAIITSPVKMKEPFALPEPSLQGYSLQIDQNTPDEIGVVVQSTVSGPVALVARSREHIYFTTTMQVVKGRNKILVPASELPLGVVQMTLFDGGGIERAERLIFANRQQRLKLEVKTDKEFYQPREKVTLTLKATDELGMPVPARLGLAVVNDQLLSLADDKSGHIMSKLLLEPELQGKVEEPNFYFDRKEPKAEEALDYLLMTAGWRRFTWTQVIEQPAPVMSFLPEETRIGGKVLNPNTGMPVKGAMVASLATGKGLATTDENGMFVLQGIDLSEPLTLKITSEEGGLAQLAIPDYGVHYTCYVYQQQPVYQWDMGDRELKQDAPQVKVQQQQQIILAAPAENIRLFAAPQQEMLNVEVVKRANVRAVNANEQKVAPKAPVAKEKDVVMNKAEGAVVYKKIMREDLKKPVIPQQPANKYYRARVFAAPVYEEAQTNYTRSDFRTTLYWNPNVELDKNGRATLSFYAGDEIASFRITAEGLGANGSPAHEEHSFHTQLPFSVSAKMPATLLQGDELFMPVLLKNNTSKVFSGTLKVKMDAGMELLSQVGTVFTMQPGEAKIVSLRYKAQKVTDTCNYHISFEGGGMSDAMSGSIRILPQGFPTGVAFSGKDGEKKYRFHIGKAVAGSIKGIFSAYPSVVSDLLKGIEGILREPSGCFEQTSMSSYPNVMIMDYMRSTDRKDEKLMASTEQLLDRGYKRLTAYESRSKGYEWFGASPAHEALTAYGLLQFNDMKRVYGGVSQDMLDRTAKWLLDRRDGKGGYKRSGTALDQFGSASEEVTNAYITYSLAAAGFRDIEKEYDLAYTTAMGNKDPYQLALMTNASYALGKTDKARKMLDVLRTKQEQDGSFMGATHSITRSYGQALRIETSALSVMALIEEGTEHSKIENVVKFLVAQRSGYGMFGSTQGTILSLKALAAYARFAKRTPEDGTIQIKVNGKLVKTLTYKAGQNDPVAFNNLGQYLGEGEQELEVAYVGVKSPLPYSVSVDYNTLIPDNDADCKVALKTTLLQQKAKVGETLRLKVQLSNTTNEGLASPMLIVGIPAGTSLQPWQLKELQERKVFDYYEIRDNELYLYYRQMAPNEVKEIGLDLKAEMAGTFEASASSAYLYYNPEFKSWSNYGTVNITP